MRTKVLLFMLVVVVFMNSFTVLAYSEGYFKYDIEDGSVIITEYFGKSEEVTVPAMIGGYPVNTIAEGAFQDTTVKKLMLPDTIMSIEVGAISRDVEVIYDSNISQKTNTDENDSGDDTSKGNPDEAGDLEEENLTADTPSQQQSSEPEWGDVISEGVSGEQEQGQLVLEEIIENEEKGSVEIAEQDEESNSKIVEIVAILLLLTVTFIGCLLWTRFRRRQERYK